MSVNPCNPLRSAKTRFAAYSARAATLTIGGDVMAVLIAAPPSIAPGAMLYVASRL
jgi:hypothetical protein